MEGTLEDGCLASDQLEHLTHCHPTGEAMWVHYLVRADALLGEGHILLVNYVPNHPLLPMSAANRGDEEDHRR